MTDKTIQDANILLKAALSSSTTRKKIYQELEKENFLEDRRYMFEAIKQAKKAEKVEDVPIGCVIVKNNKVIAKSHNLKEYKH